MTDHGLGRLPAPDARDRGYAIRAALPEAVALPDHHYFWDSGWWGDQGQDPHCVAFAWMHWVEDAPITRPETKGYPLIEPEVVYNAAQLVDEWEGENYAGTSVRAGAKVLQTLGLIAEYRWAFSVDEVLASLASESPVVLGVDWFASMLHTDSQTDADGTRRQRLVVDQASGVIGGHALIANGYNLAGRVVRLKNSWGRDWGDKGRAWITFDDLQVLLNRHGEACIGLEQRGPSPGVLNP